MDKQIDSNDGKSSSDVARHHVYSEEEAACLEQKLNNKETFREALQVLITWLEEGACDERNSARFYNLILTCWNHVKELEIKQKECLDEVQKVGEGVKVKSWCIQLQLNKIEEVFKAVEKESIVDSFTEDQRNKIEEMKTDILGFKEDIMEDSVERKVDEGESTSMKTMHNEEMVSSSTSGLIKANQKGCDDCLNEISRLNSELENSRKCLKKSNDEKRQQTSEVASQYDPDQAYPSEMEMISFISIFLVENPGVNIERIYFQFKEVVSTSVEIENLMRRYPNIFEESSVGDDQEKKWTLTVVGPQTLIEFKNNKQ